MELQEHIAFARNSYHAVWLMAWHAVRHPFTFTYLVIGSDLDGA